MSRFLLYNSGFRSTGLSTCLLRAATAAATLWIPGRAKDPGGRPLIVAPPKWP
eukprot:09593.XXX_35582_35740_1 [CDS] Oithona nana genome sequencing.